MVRAVFALFACMAAAAPGLAVVPCEALARLKLPGASIASAESVTGGSFTPPGGRPIANLPSFCRLAGTISPAADSNIRFKI
jgi:feruloyl esterase